MSIDGVSSDLVTAILMQLGFYSFEEKEGVLVAYIEKKHWNNKLKQELESTGFAFQIEEIGSRNWNAVWESNFDPIIISDRCIIRADFHNPERSYEYDIVINPKMSFGTGHHETTSMMVEYLLEHPPKGLDVIDAGTGTGILAIIAEKMGAKHISAFDTEDWAVENCLENCETNGCQNIQVDKGTISEQNDLRNSDLLLVNIHKNVLIDEMGSYFARCKKGGALVLSGFYRDDVEDLDAAAAKVGFTPVTLKSSNGWCSRVYSSPF